MRESADASSQRAKILLFESVCWIRSLSGFSNGEDAPGVLIGAVVASGGGGAGNQRQLSSPLGFCFIHSKRRQEAQTANAKPIAQNVVAQLYDWKKKDSSSPPPVLREAGAPEGPSS